MGLVLVGDVYAGLQTPIGWLGLILILRGGFGICPLYAWLGINTKSVGEKLGLKWHHRTRRHRIDGLQARKAAQLCL